MGDFKDFLQKPKKRPESELTKTPPDLPEGDAYDGDDGDEGGGGHGKSLLGYFTRENLLKQIEKGKQKARNFLPFLNREGFDAHELETMPLKKEGRRKSKQPRKVVAKKPKAKKQKAKKPAWKKAAPAKGKHAFAIVEGPNNAAAIAGIRSGITNTGKIAGSVLTAAHHANPLGYAPVSGSSPVQLGQWSHLATFAQSRSAAFAGKVVNAAAKKPPAKPAPPKKAPAKPPPKAPAPAKRGR